MTHTMTRTHTHTETLTHEEAAVLEAVKVRRWNRPGRWPLPVIRQHVHDNHEATMHNDNPDDRLVDVDDDDVGVILGQLVERGIVNRHQPPGHAQDPQPTKYSTKGTP